VIARRRLPFKRGPEESAQIAFFDYCKWKGKTDFRYNMIFHIPNGGKMSVQRKLSLARAGQKSGVPDIMVAIPTRCWAGLFLEMKIKPNRLSESQQQWIHDLNKVGYGAQVVWSADEAISVLEHYLQGAKLEK
jgi:hypothetical protein